MFVPNDLDFDLLISKLHLCSVTSVSSNLLIVSERKVHHIM